MKDRSIIFIVAVGIVLAVATIGYRDLSRKCATHGGVLLVTKCVQGIP